LNFEWLGLLPYSSTEWLQPFPPHITPVVKAASTDSETRTNHRPALPNRCDQAFVQGIQAGKEIIRALMRFRASVRGRFFH
jgi:hypothetical protein